MRRWNGWGDDSVTMEIPLSAIDLIRNEIGEGVLFKDAALDTHLERIVSPRISRHPVISVNARDRLDYSHGSGLAEWTALQTGDLEAYADGVAFPGTIDELEEVIEFAEANKIVVVPAGGGTGISPRIPRAASDRPVLSLSMKRLNRILNIDPQSRTACAEAGISGPDLEAALNVKGFTSGFFPTSFEYSMLGGWVMTCASGLMSARYGHMGDLFRGGELITPRGVLKSPPFPGRRPGPDMRRLITGSEGRTGVLTKAWIRIFPLPEKDAVYGFLSPTWEKAVETARTLVETDIPFTFVRISDTKATRLNLALAGKGNDIASALGAVSKKRISSDAACVCMVGLAGSAAAVDMGRRNLFSCFGKAECLLIGKTGGRAWLKNRFRDPYLRDALWNFGYITDHIKISLPGRLAASAPFQMKKAVSEALETENENVFSYAHMSFNSYGDAELDLHIVFRRRGTYGEMMSRCQSVRTAVQRAGNEIGLEFCAVGGGEPEMEPLQKGVFKSMFNRLDPDEILNPGKVVF